MNIQLPNLALVRYGFPVPEMPFYHVRLRLDETLDSPIVVRQVHTNGKRTRDFFVYNDGRYNRMLTFQGGQQNEIVVRLDWLNGSKNVIELAVTSENGEEGAIRHESDAPVWGGYWDSRWRYYGSQVVEENQGIARFDEPVHLLMSVYADRMTDPQRQLRVVSIDPATGEPTEIACQVSGVSTWDKRADIHCQPTTTFEVAFFATVPARTAKVYLIFYGNPEAAAPDYHSDLVVSGTGLDAVISNSHYKISLHPKSGVINEILLKQGVDVLFDHHLETNGAVHWNPGVYAPPRTWIHTSDWDPPAGQSATVGPLFATFKRWGPLPEYPEVECSVTYTFYANQPYVLMSSTIDVLEDIHVQALRNGEIVLNHNVVREFAWKKLNGEIGSVVIKERPRHPTRGLDVDAWTPWWAFYNREIPCALAAINLELTNVQRSQGRARWEPYYYMHWGPWAYCARPLVYTFATPNPQRVMRVPASSGFYEKIAYLPCRLGASDFTRFDPIESAWQQLVHPLSKSVTALDIDPRTPEEWTPPILVSEFEEME